MSSNFRIITQRNAESVHLKLRGEFDGSSAYELINILDNYSNDTRKIFIHTSGISSLHSFGINIFKTKYSRYQNIVFTGDHVQELALRRSQNIP